MKDLSRNLTMLCDFYELTMSNGYFQCGLKDRIVYFDVFYRNNPDNGGATRGEVWKTMTAYHIQKKDVPGTVS